MEHRGQLFTALGITLGGVVIIGLIYLLTDSLGSEALYGLALGLVCAVVADVLLYTATKNPTGWIKFYAMRVVVILIGALLGVLLPFVDPVTTLLALIISLPAVIVSAFGKRNNG